MAKGDRQTWLSPAASTTALARLWAPRWRARPRLAPGLTLANASHGPGSSPDYTPTAPGQVTQVPTQVPNLKDRTSYRERLLNGPMLLRVAYSDTYKALVG